MHHNKSSYYDALFVLHLEILRPITYHLPATAYYLLPTTNALLPITYATQCLRSRAETFSNVNQTKATVNQTYEGNQLRGCAVVAQTRLGSQRQEAALSRHPSLWVTPPPQPLAGNAGDHSQLTGRIGVGGISHTHMIESHMIKSHMIELNTCLVECSINRVI